MSYGVDVSDLLRGAASYIDRILRGERPNELPVQQPTRFELVINAKTAKTLGLNIDACCCRRGDGIAVAASKLFADIRAALTNVRC
jgi:putative ABC transport system substrate-binding protein